MISALCHMNKVNCGYQLSSLEIISDKDLNLLTTYSMVRQANILKHVHFPRKVF